MLQLTDLRRVVSEWVRRIWREVAAFGVVGAVAFVVETASFNLLILGPPSAGGGIMRATPALASVVATLLAMAVSWFGNRHWTYRDRRGAVDRREVAWFVAINLAGMAVTAVPVFVSRELLGLGSPLSDNAARLVGWAAATVLRFVAYRTLVFTPAGKDPAPVPATVSRWTKDLNGAWRRGSLWPWCLGAVAALCALAVNAVFHPGYLSQDSADQLQQALGERPVTDWHPPVMALLWRILIHTTGAISAMAALQSAVLWATLWVLARLVWRRTGSRGLSLAMLAVGLTPQILTFTGVVWKDVHMAYALLAAVAVALTARELPPGRAGARWALLVLGVLFLAYAVLVRKNGLPAVIPVFVLLVLAVWPSPGRRRWLAASGILLVTTAVCSVGVSEATDPVATRQYAQIPLDDLTHVLTAAQIGPAAEKAGASADFRARLVTATAVCARRHVPADVYFNCYPRNPSLGVTELGRNADVLTRMWTQQMPGHWQGYIAYRARVFSKLLFQGNLPFYDGSTTRLDALKSAPVNQTLMSTVRDYVLGFVRDVPMLFQGWFWFALSLVFALRRRWAGPYSRELRLLGASSALYILAYLPTAPQSNFRYVYWPALAGTVGVATVLIGHLARRRAAVTGPLGSGAAAPTAPPVPAGADDAGPHEDVTVAG
ncbi:GtrA family protein [Streptomyces sp. NBC_00083]|uniref:GtrA family protein n=1 Tax=Streptomyces sp. NBC_00083 TaxID=2975647 RepID=UPI002253C6BA|nr:GtrA family protein [Streptomyces sp. NBC_00083]MCX5387203.1 GtrA family protein [Streptomyces sp. NBC_00083]